MRIKSFLAVSIAGLTLGLMGCGTEAVVVPSSEPAAVSEQAPTGEQESLQSTALVGICPLKWTCNFQTFYSTQTQCTTACGGSECWREYACTGGCVCP
ncbi:hypothetical protein CYFUS_003959 [Cystobacter fuscus]|uniref:Lipoprotein n=1 Tax=Cystobacter fuscus TaxID=43 RepID=A0A250J3I9_9BACT|nr:hypothetical protein [Cystobacter fuscus]ATB38524.1 hypothetical protein CYFUS_003959 [Cystobacter fuscus]